MKVLYESKCLFSLPTTIPRLFFSVTSKRKFNEVNARKTIVLMKSSVTVMFFLHISKLLCIAGGANILSAYRLVMGITVIAIILCVRVFSVVAQHTQTTSDHIRPHHANVPHHSPYQTKHKHIFKIVPDRIYSIVISLERARLFYWQQLDENISRKF